MALDAEDCTWIIELESVLLDDCSASDIYAVCKGKSIPENIRADVWQVCLGVQNKGNQMINFNEIFDLPNQNVLREDVMQFVEKLGNDEDDKVSVTSDLESILTFYCKNRNVKYFRNNGWIELLLPLLNLKLPRSDTYNLFEKLLDTYVPKDCGKNGVPFHLLWLLLQYHDPELCSFLDTKRITPEQYCQSWFQSLFSGICTLPVAQSMWDLYFQQEDPFFIFFLALIMIVNAREMILSKKEDKKEKIIELLLNMPAALEAEDVNDFCSLAQYYAHKTPTSFQTEVAPILFSTDSSPRSKPANQPLCLPVSVHELVENATMEISSDPEGVRFFLVDCRPADQYNAGHLSTAFHLDCNLMLQEPSAFATAVQGLLSAQKQALAANSLAAGEHLCFLGSGRVEEDGYAHMVIAAFLKRNIKHVSMLEGGFRAIHDYFGDHMVDCLEDHDFTRCLVCAPQGLQKEENTDRPVQKINAPSLDLFSKLSATMKMKSQEVKGKLIDYIVNPNANASSTERHVSRNDKNGKRYRNVAPVFSIDDENDSEIAEDFSPDEDSLLEIVTVSDWLKSSNIIGSFKCQEVMMNGYMYDAYLAVTTTHLIVLRDVEGKKGCAQIVARRPLSTVVKITAKRRHPELIIFKYGMPDGDTLVIKDMDRFLIPNAREATQIVSNQILKHLDG